MANRKRTNNHKVCFDYLNRWFSRYLNAYHKQMNSRLQLSDSELTEKKTVNTSEC